MPKYKPLGDYLIKQRHTKVILTFQEIKEILGFPLTQSAYRHRAWWANTSSHPQALAWLNIGWKVKAVDFENEIVTFLNPIVITIDSIDPDSDTVSLKVGISKTGVEFMLSGPAAAANTAYSWHQIVQTLININPHLFGYLTKQPMHHVFPEMLAKLGYTVVNPETGESWGPYSGPTICDIP